MIEPRQYTTFIQDSGDPGHVNRILIGIPSTGLKRDEWIQARYGQVIPMNWSQVEMMQFMNSYMTLRYQVADAQNMIVKQAIDLDFEFLLLFEHDILPPPMAFVRLNHYMRECKVPVVSGLYYSRSRPSEPLVFRGRGNGAWLDWEMGGDLWVDGVPTGFLLIHGSILRAMWDESEEYQIQGTTTRRVFNTPRNAWYDPESGQYNSTAGTSDLDWCTRVMRERFFEKAGWPEYQNKKYPFLVDTKHLFCRHINFNGEQFP